MNALFTVEGDEFRGRVVRVQFDLIDGRDNLARGVREELGEILNAEVGDANVTNFAGRWELLHFLPATLLAVIGEVEVSGREAYHVLMKSQSDRCFFLSSGSVDEGQCYAVCSSVAVTWTLPC